MSNVKILNVQEIKFPAKVINNPLLCFSPSRYHEKQSLHHEREPKDALGQQNDGFRFGT